MSARITLVAALTLITGFCGAARAADLALDASKATVITLPAAGETPVAFKTPDGKDGWVRRISNERLPTPAYAKGRLFTGGGYSSRTFLAIDAATGKTLWSKGTQDNGPTSPVVADKNVAYNTESCHTEVRDADDGNLVWSEVTGGTLLTQPLIANNTLVIPHPTMQRKAAMADNTFRMLGVSLASLKHTWDADMTGDVLGAPVADAGRAYFTCTDGRLFCLNTRNGASDWHVVAGATSAPVVVGKLLAVTTEEKSGDHVLVGIRRYDAAEGTLQDEKPLAPTAVSPATDVDVNERGAIAGYAGWDYQGPKIAHAHNRLFNAPGNTINAVALDSGKILWRATLTGDGLTDQAHSLTPPALGKDRLYLGSARGHVLALNQADGALAFSYKLSAPLASQPILAEGNLYIATADGLLVCIKLHDKDAEGWYAWGGDAQHNKVD